jgi:hypothetical protein
MLAELYNHEGTRETDWMGSYAKDASCIFERTLVEGEVVVVMGAYGVKTEYEVLAVDEHKAILVATK